MTTGTESYYERRAPEYDRVYEKPERQDDIRQLRAFIDDSLDGRRVLDVAAGTAFWTARYVDRARQVTIVDVNLSTLEVARQRRRWPTTTDFHECDAFALDRVPGRWDAAFVGFFWSHIPLDSLDTFLDGLTSRLEPRSIVVLADNNYVSGSNHPLSRTDSEGNTFQRRGLSDGSDWEVLKNFPSPEELTTRLGRFGRAEVLQMPYYWAARMVTGDV